MKYPDLFERCLVVVLRNEGGFSNHPSDPGGATMQGITQVVYDGYRARNGEHFQGVGLITEEEVKDIYYSQYWQPMNLEGIMDDALVLDVFDMGVNSGIRMSVKILQRLVGVKDDGFIGEQTLRAIREFNGDIVIEYKKRRKLFYVTLVQSKPQFRPFAKGWINRVDRTIF